MPSMKEVVIRIRVALVLSGLLVCCGTCVFAQDDQASTGRQDGRNSGNGSYDDNSNSSSGNDGYQQDGSARDFRDTEESHSRLLKNYS